MAKNPTYYLSEAYQKGYADGVKDTTEKACECFELAQDWTAWSNGDWEYAKEYFRKAMEE